MSFGVWSSPAVSTKTAAAASASIIDGNKDRAYLSLTNHHSDKVWLNLGAHAEANKGWHLGPGDTIEFRPGSGDTFEWLRGAVYALSENGTNASLAAIETLRPVVGGESGNPGVTIIRSISGANFALPSVIMTFGDPGATPAHSTPLDDNFDETAAQAEKISLAAPASGRSWQTLQLTLRWDTAPLSPVAGTPDMFIVIYWETAEGWHRINWPAKYIDDSSSVEDMRYFSDFTSFDFPIGATAFAVGVAGYVDGKLYVDLRAKG